MTDLTLGVDVSKWQGPIDWAAVGRSGLAQFAAVRVAIGLTPDERWEANLRGAVDHVPLPMAYAVVGTKAAQADAADYLVNLVDRVADASRVVLVVDAEDFSDGSHPTMVQVHQFRDALHRLTGRYPHAYCPGWWMSGHGYETDAAPWPWWPSKYVAPAWDATRLTRLQPALDFGFAVAGPWQFTSSGSVAGISGRVDRNCYFGTLAELRALTLGGEQDMPLSDADIPVIRKALGLKTGEEVASTTDVATILRGDATHPYSLQDILAAVKEAGVTITDAQAEIIGAKLLTALQVGRLSGQVAVELGPE